MKTNAKSILLLFPVITMLWSFTSCCKDHEVEVKSTISATLNIDKMTCKKGETINLTTKIEGTVNGQYVTFNVVYYFDDIEIGTSSESKNNYPLRYLVKDDISVGKHIIKSVASYNEENISLKRENTLNINVTE